jgi:hypothetical protein
MEKAKKEVDSTAFGVTSTLSRQKRFGGATHDRNW